MITLLCVKLSALAFLCLSFPSSKSSVLSLGKVAMILFLQDQSLPLVFSVRFTVPTPAKGSAREGICHAKRKPGGRSESRLPKTLSGGQVLSFWCAILEGWLLCTWQKMAGEMLKTYLAESQGLGAFYKDMHFRFITKAQNKE